MNFAYLGGRRFIMCMIFGFAYVFLVWFEKITGGEFVLIMGSTVAVYVAGGTAQKFTNPVTDYESGFNPGYQGRDPVVGHEHPYGDATSVYSSRVRRERVRPGREDIDPV